MEKIIWTDRERNEEVLYIVKEEGANIQIKSGRTKLIGHILRWSCFLKHVIEGKMEERTEVMGRRGIRRKELLDDLNPLNAESNPICNLLALLGAHHILHISSIRVKERRGYWKLKEKAPDRTLWRTCFERGYGSVVSQRTE